MHVVQRGETLWHISRRYNVTIDAIVLANQLPDRNMIRVGQKLIIPGLDSEDTPLPQTPVAKPLPGSPFTYRTYTNMYGARPAKIFVVKFPLDGVLPMLLYPGAGPPFKNRTISSLANAARADLAVNCSFFYGGYPLGRHISNNEKVYAYPPATPTIIVDSWRLDTWYDGIDRLLKNGVQNAFSSHPYLLYNKNLWLSKHNSELAAPHPRTAVGLSADMRQMIVVVVDGRRVGYSLGVTLAELQRLMWAEGARAWALNLDGGGSSAMWFRGKIINRPSYGEREVVNVLAFRSK